MVSYSVNLNSFEQIFIALNPQTFIIFFQTIIVSIKNKSLLMK